MCDTLILNADGMPISLVPLSSLSWSDSIKLMYLDRVDVVAEYEDWEIHSPSTTVKVPAVMILRNYIRYTKTVKFSRENVILRDNFKCQYCGMDAFEDTSLLTMDHVVPRKLGGMTKWDNIVAACSPCNLKKGHFTKMKPSKMPERPSYYQLLDHYRKKHLTIPHPAWNDYLGWDLKNITVRPARKNHNSGT